MNGVLRAAATAALLTATLGATAAFSEDRVLLLSAYPAEQAVLLREAGASTVVGTFNGRRFFEGTLAGKTVVLGLTGIGMVNSARTAEAALAWFEENELPLAGIVFSGVAGGPNLGDVVVPDRWTDWDQVVPVDPEMFAVAAELEVALDPRVPVTDTLCTGDHGETLRTPLRVEEDPRLRLGGLGASGDPYGGRAVPCLSSAGDLLGCEACGAPANPSPGVARFVEESIPFFDPQFFLGLFQSFSSGGGSGAVVGDMETAAVARIAFERDIPFLAFRAVSDGGGDPNPATALLGFPFQFAAYQQLAADNAAAAVLEFLEQWQP